MQETLDGIFVNLGAFVPNLIAALLILIVGWLIAAGVSALVRAGLRRTDLDNRLARSVAGSGSEASFKTEEWISRGVFWLIMLFVIIAFLQALNLTVVSGPLNNLLDGLLGFIPNLIGALILIAVAWLVATVLRLLVTRGLQAVNFDERVGSEMRDQQRDNTGMASGSASSSSSASSGSVRSYDTSSTRARGSATGTTRRTSLSETLGNVVYWLVFLLFLPAILDALELQGLLQPVNNLLNEVLAFLPNLFAAALIIVAGWFVARIVQRIVTNLLAAVGTDRLAERIGLANVLGQQRLSGLLGLIVYILILIPVVIAGLNALQLDAITAPASQMLNTFLNAIPDIFAAALILVIAYFVGRLISNLVVNLLRGFGFDNMFRRVTGTSGTVQTPSPTSSSATAAPGQTSSTAATGTSTTSPSDIVGYIVLVGIMLFASIAAFNTLGFEIVAVMISQFTVLVGQIILGLIIFAIGLFLANLAARAIVSSGVTQAGLLALAARISIIVLAGAMALRQMGLANEIVNLAFGLLLGAVAVAFALAFGLGGREPARQEVERWFQTLRNRNIQNEPLPGGETPAKAKTEQATRRLEGGTTAD